MSNTSRCYWAGMSKGVKVRLCLWLIYFAIALGAFLHTPFVGVILLALPVIWFIAKNWLLASMGAHVELERKNTLLGYTSHHLWQRLPKPVQGVLSFVWVGAVLVGLGWLLVLEYRDWRAPPSLAERAVASGEAAVEATAETTSGWIETAKGWFKSDAED